MDIHHGVIVGVNCDFQHKFKLTGNVTIYGTLQATHNILIETSGNITIGSNAIIKANKKIELVTTGINSNIIISGSAKIGGKNSDTEYSTRDLLYTSIGSESGSVAIQDTARIFGSIIRIHGHHSVDIGQGTIIDSSKAIDGGNNRGKSASSEGLRETYIYSWRTCGFMGCCCKRHRQTHHYYYAGGGGANYRDGYDAYFPTGGYSIGHRKHHFDYQRKPSNFGRTLKGNSKSSYDLNFFASQQVAKFGNEVHFINFYGSSGGMPC